MTHEGLRQMYNAKYAFENWVPLQLRPNGWSTSRYDDIARLLEGCSGRALDVGCGSGRLTLALATQFDSIVGVDLSPVRIELAQSVLQANHPELETRVSFQVADADEPLPFPDESFDNVIVCAVLEHVVDVFHAMSEFARVTRRGGRLVLCVPNICYVKHALGLFAGRVPLTGSHTRSVDVWREDGWDGGHFHYFSRQTLGDLLELQGFRPEAWTGDGRLAKLRRWHSSLVGNLTVRSQRVQ